MPEYWIVDPIKHESLFYQLNDRGVYEAVEPDINGIYHSRSLTQLKLPVEILWRDQLPSVTEIIRMVEAMLKDNR